MNADIESRITRTEVANLLAAKLGISFRSAYDRMVFTHGFPKPVSVPSPTGSRPIMRWVESEVIGWIGGLKKAA